jgi:hypothetical protein
MTMFHLATPPKHQFGNPVSVAPDPTLGRCEQAERTCRMCQLVKITAFTPDGVKRLWRLPGQTEQVALFDAPACQPAEVAAS